MEDICSTTKQFNSWWKKHKKERDIGDESISTLARWPLLLKLIRFRERFVTLKSPLGRRKKVAIRIVDDIIEAGVSEIKCWEWTTVAREKWIFRTAGNTAPWYPVFSKCNLSYNFGKKLCYCLAIEEWFLITSSIKIHCKKRVLIHSFYLTLELIHRK